MKRIKFTSSFLMVAAAFAALPGFAVTVSTVAELKAAVKGASAGDKIVITTSLTPSASDFTAESDGTKSFLTVTKDNLIIMGADESSRKTWEQGAEPVIINCGSVGRFLQNNGSNLTVKNIAVTGCRLAANQYGTIAQGNSCTFTNCVFRQNLGAQTAFWAHGNFILRDCSYVSNAAPFTGSAYGCDFSNITSQAKFVHHLYDCNFTGYVRTGDAAIILNGGETAGTIVSNCHFSSCRGMPLLQPQANYKTMIMDCLFEDNTNTLISATLKDTAANGVVVSNCTFTANVTANSTIKWHGMYMGYLVYNATNNFASLDAAQSKFSIIDSTFVDSSYTDGRGMTEIYFVNARGCKFKPYASYLYNNWNALNVSAMDSRLQACEVAGGAVVNCVVDRCEVHDVPSDAHACFRDYCRVTNTLVRSCSASIFGAAWGHDAEFVNCTFATNSGLTYIANTAGSLSGDVKFLNCLFNSNVRGAAASDISINNDDNSLNRWTDRVSFGSSFYGKFKASGKLTAEVFAAKTNGVDTLSLCVDPKFVKDSRPDASYWSLLPKSPLIGKGDASIWTAEDVDLVGKLRLKDGKVDPGCYQCWINPPGMVIVFR